MIKKQILVVEDDNIVVLELRHRLQNLGYDVVGLASYGEEAIEKAGEARPDLVLMDIRLRGHMDGITAAEEIRTRYGIPVVYLTAYTDNDTLRRAKVTEPYGYIIKPFQEAELLTAIEIALYKHEMERKLRASEERYRSLFEGAADPIFIVDQDLQYVTANPSALRAVGSTLEDLVTKGPSDLFPEDMGSHISQYCRVFETGQPVRFERERRLPDGLHWFSVTLSPIKGADGHVTALTDISRDSTVRKQAEEELKRRNEDLELAYGQLQQVQDELVKAERLAAMSQIGVTVRHEVNSPLTVVLGDAQWLLDKKKTLPSDIREVVGEIESAAIRIRDVVSKLDQIEDRPVPYWGQTMMIDIRSDSKG